VSLKELLDETSPFLLDYLFGIKSENATESTFPDLPVRIEKKQKKKTKEKEKNREKKKKEEVKSTYVI
jgi:hypothetical protein